MIYVIAIAFVAGFAAGWAFFKHRAGIKKATEDKLKAAAHAAVDKI